MLEGPPMERPPPGFLPRQTLQLSLRRTVQVSNIPPFINPCSSTLMVYVHQDVERHCSKAVTERIMGRVHLLALHVVEC
jgi:hypothetical protein